MKIGGVVAIGTDTEIPVYIDSRVLEQEKVVMGGGNRSRRTHPKPQELLKLPNVQLVEDLAKATPHEKHWLYVPQRFRNRRNKVA